MWLRHTAPLACTLMLGRRTPWARGKGARAYTRAPMAPDVISFARGAPSADLLPAESIAKAAEKALETDAVRALSYGTGIGHPDL